MKIKSLNKSILIIFTFIFFIFFLVSCKPSTNENDKIERPIIKIGSEDYAPFMDLDNNGNPTGIDVDILKIAFDRLEYDVKFVTISWESKDSMLESGEVDCITGGFTIEGREDDYLWVGPYMKCNQVIVVNSTSNIKTFKDLEGKAIAVQAASVAEKMLLEQTNSNVPSSIKIYSYEDNTLPFAVLGCNYIDALVADETAVIQYMQDYDNSFTILEEPLIYGSIGTAFSKNGNKELCAKVNEEINKMLKDGTIKEIISSYLTNIDRYLIGEDNEE